jgi:hypothetical protein
MGRGVPRAQTLYDLTTKCRCGVFPYIPEESHPVLSEAKGPLGHGFRNERNIERKTGSYRSTDLPMWQ